MQGEHHQTTRDLIAGARTELAAVGQAAFTMDGVVRRSFYSSGALYERWPDRADLLADVGREVRDELGRALAGLPDAPAAFAWALDDARDVLTLAGEILIAGHTSPSVRAIAIETWTTLREGLERVLPPGMAWYTAAVAIGGALLDVIGLPGPRPPTGRITWLTEACTIEIEQRHVPLPGGASPGVDVPEVPLPVRSDATAQALIQAAQALLAEHGAEGISTRRVSAAAGVTTGAIYRRYDGKAALLSDVLLAELAPDRYAWTWELVRALATDDPYWGAADAMTRQLFAATADETSQRVLLQIGVAARNDDALRSQVQQRVLVAHQARTDMFARLAEAGVMRDDVDPSVLAWGFQTEPVGVRAILPLGIPLDEVAVTTSMRAILTAAAARA